MSKQKYLLLTGATGLLGRYLLRDLLQADERVAIIIRATAKESVRQRTEQIMQMWEGEAGKALCRPVCLEGDVTQPGLGLNREAQRWVAGHCDRMLHSAAVLTFRGADRSNDPWRTNVGGTENVLDFCEQADIRKLHYVSTAYVCGLRQGLIKEDELDVGQGFRNDYEHSKLLAEQLVHDADFLDGVTIYRPAVIAGDSQTGYTNTYHGLYLYLRLMSMLVPLQPADEQGRRHTPIRLPMTGDEQRNIIPVDWVSRVIARLLAAPQAHGRTFHLAPRQPLTPRKIIDAGYRYFNSTGVEYVGKQRISPNPGNRFESDFLGGVTTYESYDWSDPTFDTSNLSRFVPDLPCPEIDEAMLYRYLRFGEEDRWGKRRASPVAVNEWVEDYLVGLVKGTPDAAAGLRGDQPLLELGLDITGAGGGQWTLRLCGRDVASIQAGLPDTEMPVLRAHVEQFRQLVEGGASPQALSAFLLPTEGGRGGRVAKTVARVLRATENGNGRHREAAAH